MGIHSALLYSALLYYLALLYSVLTVSVVYVGGRGPGKRCRRDQRRCHGVGEIKGDVTGSKEMPLYYTPSLFLSCMSAVWVLGRDAGEIKGDVTGSKEMSLYYTEMGRDATRFHGSL
jgi:hypothetical protein